MIQFGTQTSNKFANATVTLEEYTPPAKAFSEASWEEIGEVLKTGSTPPHWKVGDEKDVTIGGNINETVTMVIVGLNHDDKADGSGKAPITLGMKNLMTTQKQMNKARSNIGSFVATDMYLWLQMEIFPNLPIELQKLVTPVAKKTTAGSSSATIRTDSMKLWLFSNKELDGSYSDEGTRYAYYTQNTSLVKRTSNGAGSANYWWLRSPYTGTDSNFWCVYSDGGVSTYAASSSYGVCFGFAIDAPSESYSIEHGEQGLVVQPTGKYKETVPLQSTYPIMTMNNKRIQKIRDDSGTYKFIFEMPQSAVTLKYGNPEV